MCEIVNSPLFVKHSTYHQHIDTSNMKWSHRGYPADGQSYNNYYFKQQERSFSGIYSCKSPLLEDYSSVDREMRRRLILHETGFTR